MNKTIKYISAAILGIAVVASCHKIEVPITTELTPSVFPKDSAQFIQAMGPAYVAFRGDFSLSYWFMETLTTDEAILPARGGNWYDNQNYSMLHYHSWTQDHGWTNGTWSWLSTTIGTINQAMLILDQNEPSGPVKQGHLAELRTLRALTYFIMMDIYGNVPIDTSATDFTPHANVARKDVFNFIESEVKAAMPYLSTAVDVSTYGRVNLYTAYALLAKMYLNAEYYTGTARYDDCIAACDFIMSSGKFALEPRASYLKMFYPDNGPQMKEFIFAVPYDPNASNGYIPVNGQMYHARYDVPRSEREKFELSFTPSAPESTLPEFYAYFSDPGDIRNGQWLTGLQFMNDGVTPVTVTTTKKGYDQFYSGSDGNASYTYQVDLTPDIILRQDPDHFDCGNDEVAWNMGYRNIKFYPDKTSSNRNQNNDVPMFRYADIVLMKAEAILRGGSPTMGQTALSLVNELRANRTTSAPWTTVNLDSLYNERCREFAWEAWHRNDMIRFGKYEGSWGFKTDSDPNRRIFPIPTVALKLNPELTQNPGY